MKKLSFVFEYLANYQKLTFLNFSEFPRREPLHRVTVFNLKWFHWSNFDRKIYFSIKIINFRENPKKISKINFDRKVKFSIKIPGRPRHGEKITKDKINKRKEEFQHESSTNDGDFPYCKQVADWIPSNYWGIIFSVFALYFN